MNNRFDNRGREQNIAQGDGAIGRQTNIFLQPLKSKTIAILLVLVAAITGAGIVGWHLLEPTANIIAGGNVTVEGIPPELFAKYVKEFGETFGETEAVVNGFFVTLLERKVPRDQWDSTLRKIAAQHKELLQQLKSVQAENPEMVQLKEDIRQAIVERDYTKAQYLLNRAEVLQEQADDNAMVDDSKPLSDASLKTPGRKHSGRFLDLNLPPNLDLLAPTDGSSFRSPALTVRYRVRIHDNGPPVTSIQVNVDGRPLHREQVKRCSDTEWEGTVDVTLPAKDMILSLIAENGQAAASLPASITLHWQGSKDALKPVLYLLAVGVDEYDAPEINLDKGKKYLKYASKDARDFAALMMEQAGPHKLYREVKTCLLTNRTADQDAVLKRLKWIEQESTVNDVAMVFLAGNSRLDSHGDYYFLPRDFRPWRYTTSGVSWVAIRSTIARLRSKTLFLVDTCYSGRAAEQRGGVVDITRIINDLNAAENRVIVLSAATGLQAAQERDEWQHGAFTKALLEALQGAANYVQDGDGVISVTELITYLAHRVPRLTEGRQTPAIVIPKNVPDFPVVVLP